jgi:hypothetical protein
MEQEDVSGGSWALPNQENVYWSFPGIKFVPREGHGSFNFAGVYVVIA